MRSILLLISFAGALGAQWDPVLPKNVPRLASGKPNLAARTPRTKDGKTDLSGVWWIPLRSDENDQDAPPPKYAVNLAADLAPDAVPMRPASAALFQKRAEGLGKDFPSSRCTPPGVPLNYTIPTPFKIVQTPEVTVVLHEEANLARQIFTDGRKLPRDPIPAWMGYSIGHWEGDALVVESSGFNDKTWLDAAGHPHGEKLRVTERYRRLNVGNMEIEITIADPEHYERPWTVKVAAELLPEVEMLESVCLEGEKDLAHLVGQ